MHAWSTSMLLLLHSAFMLSVVKMLLKVEVGGCAINNHGNYIVDYGKIMELCSLISVGTLTFANSLDPDQARHNVGPDLD